MDIIENTLEQEIRRFNELLPQLLKWCPDKWAVITGVELLGCWDTVHAAYNAGVDRVGIIRPFLVQQVMEEQPVQRIPWFRTVDRMMIDGTGWKIISARFPVEPMRLSHNLDNFTGLTLDPRGSMEIRL